MATISVGETEVDYFSVHNRKEKEVTIEMLDYDFVSKCNDLDDLKGVLAILRSGKEGKYPQLEKATEDRILAILPEKERNHIVSMRTGPTGNEVESELSQLRSWSQDMNMKSKQVEQGFSRPSSLSSSKTKNRPPVRGKQSHSTTNPKNIDVNGNAKENSSSEPKMVPKISAYDWRAWEKFDVDAAIKEVDEENEQVKRKALDQREQMESMRKERLRELAKLPSYLDLSSLSKTELEISALNEKQKGNECFKCGENDEALLYYSRSLAFDSTNAIVYANRALVYLRQKQFEAAENDCTRAIELDPLYLKAWSRRGMTRHRRGKYQEAAEDFRQAMELDPKNQEIKKLLLKTHEKWKEVEGERYDRRDEKSRDEQIENKVEEKLSRSTSSHSFQPRVGTLPENNSYEKGFQRIQIIEENGSDDEDDDDDSEEEETTVASSFQRFEIIEDE